MIDHLFPYYERELRYLNLLTQEFAQRHPKTAQRLGLEATGSSDPYVQRLLETSALFAGRAQAKIDDEFPEISDALLQFLYPHFMAPIPSMSVVQFDIDATRLQTPTGFPIPKDSVVEAATEPVKCKFRTAYPTTLWPIRLRRASFRGPPFPVGLTPPDGTVAAICLEVESVGELAFEQLQMEGLRFCLVGDPQMIPDLYEVLLNHALQVAFLPKQTPSTRTPIYKSPTDCLRPVGFERDEGLLPYAESSRMGYRLLTEFFVFPMKFHFIELTGWRKLVGAGLGRICEIVIFCDKTIKSLEQGVDTQTFRLNCVPIVNLFEKAAEPLEMRSQCPEYRIVADQVSPRSMEVYSVTSASSTDPATNRTTQYSPFFGLEHSQGTRGRGIFWYTTRRRSLAENDSGTDVFLSLVNLQYEPRWPTDELLQVQLLCTNRDLPLQLSTSSSRVSWSLQLPAPVNGVACLAPPTPPLRPAVRRGRAWELISHLTLGPLALQDGLPGRTALRDILRLYDFSDPAAGQRHLKDQAQQIVDGVLNVGYRRVLGRVPSDPGRGLCRGVEVTIELDPMKFPMRGAYLFAAVFDRFLGSFVTTNSFTELIFRTQNRLEKKWPARTGEIPLV